MLQRLSDTWPCRKSYSRRILNAQDLGAKEHTLLLVSVLVLLELAADKAPSSASRRPAGNGMPATWDLQQDATPVCPAVGCSCKLWSAELCARRMLAHRAAAGALAASVWLLLFMVAGWVPLLAVMTITVDPDETSAGEPPSGWLSSVNVVSCLKLVLTCKSILRPVG